MNDVLMTVSPVAWLIIMVFALVMYAILAGASVGMGIALLLQRGPQNRRATAEIIGSAWDGNETWLILIAVGLWAGFPRLFGVLLPHVFIPGVVMLLAIGVRGASIELASARPQPTRWLWLIGGASVMIVATQGLMLGATTQIVTTRDGAYAGNAVQFFSPFSVLVAILLVLIAATEGLAFLRFKAAGDIAQRAGDQGRVVAGFAGIMAVITSLSLQATPGAQRLDDPARLVIWIVLVAVAVVGGIVVWWNFPHLTTSRPATPLAGVIVAIVAGWLSLAVGRAPLLLPPDFTAANSASPTYSIDFLIVGIGLNIPLLIIYNWHTYSAFRGDPRPDVRDRPAGRSLTSAVLTPPSRTETAPEVRA